MKWYIWIVVIIAIAAGIRVLFNQHFPGYQTSGDSVSYYLTLLNLKERKNLVDPWRTPVYPILLAAPYVWSRKPLPAELPREYFSQELWTIRIAQSFAGIATLVLLFFILIRVKFSTNLAGVYCVFIACHPTLMINEFSLLTEAFATLWLVALLYVSVLLLSRVDMRKSIMFAAFCILGVFLRPSYIVFPPVILAILLWHHRSRLVVAFSVVVLCIYGVTVSLYIQSNDRIYAYRGISRISDVNILGKILLYKLPVDTTADSVIKNRVVTYTQDFTDVSPWGLYRQYPDLFNNEYATPMSIFVRDVFRRNFGLYFIGATKELPGAIMEIGEVDPIIQRTARWETLFLVLSRVYRLTQLTHFILIIAIPFLIIDLMRKQTIQKSTVTLFAFVSLYHIALGVYMGYGEYVRHLSVVVPIMYIVSFWFVGEQLTRYRAKTQNEKHTD